MRRILFVDDEPRILDGLKKALRVHRDRWIVELADSAAAALALLERLPCDAIVTDARMPWVGGVELLRQVAPRWPGMLRYVLSGQTDPTANDQLAVVAHQFLAKPIPAVELFERVERGCRLADRLAAEKVRAAVCGVTVLPEFPWLVNRLRQALDDRAPQPAVLASIVARGPALAARALQLTNSDFVGRTQPVVSLREAVARLGAEGCRVILASVVPVDAEGPMLDELGRRVTSLARLSAAASTQPEAAYSAGLLAKLGVLVLAHQTGEGYAAIWARHLSGEPLDACEAALLGHTHADVGATLLGLWNLPAALVDAVGLQPAEPFCVPNESVTNAVKLARAIDAEQRTDGRGATDVLAEQLSLGPRLDRLRRIAAAGAEAGA